MSMRLLEQIVLHEAVPRKAKQLGLTPEDPPDLNNFDPNAGGGGDDPPPIDGTGGNDPPPTDDPADTNPPPDVDPNAGGGNDDPPPIDGTGGNDPPPTDDMGGDDPNAMGDDSDAPPMDDSDSPAGPDMGMDQPGQELDQAEQDLFKDLKPEQKEVRDRELKERFQDLYAIITDTLEKLNKVTKTSYDARMLELVIKQLVTLKDLVLIAVTKNFKAKTYIENKVELNSLATEFNQITNTIETIYNARVKRTLKYEKNVTKPNVFDGIDFSQDLAF